MAWAALMRRLRKTWQSRDSLAHTGGTAAKFRTRRARWRISLRAMRSAAESFGERDVSEVIARFTEGDDTQAFEPGELASIRSIADVLADPSADARNLAALVDGMDWSRLNARDTVLPTASS